VITKPLIQVVVANQTFADLEATLEQRCVRLMQGPTRAKATLE
jgi:hypothetical protein